MIDTVHNYIGVICKIIGICIAGHIIYKKHTKGDKPTKWQLFTLIILFL